MTGTDSAPPFVKLLTIIKVIPCLADPNKIRFSAEFDRDVSEIFPYLNTVLQGAIYNHSGRTLTIRKEGRLITLYPATVSAAKIDDVHDAHEVISWLIKLINECHLKRATIKPSFERRDCLQVIDIVRLLPGTNCKKCDQPTCLAFAALIAAEKVSVMGCGEILLAENQEKRKELFALLRAGGYSIPEAFG